MDKKIAALILLWHGVHVALGQCIESARVVLDQTDRGTLLPDRVREMRGELLATQEMIPKLADLLEELISNVMQPTKMEAPSLKRESLFDEPDPETAAEEVPAAVTEAFETGTGDYDTEGSTPIEPPQVDEEAAAEAIYTGELGEPDADANDTP